MRTSQSAKNPTLKYFFIRHSLMKNIVRENVLYAYTTVRAEIHGQNIHNDI